VRHALKAARLQSPVLTNSDRVARSKNNPVDCFNEVKDMRLRNEDKQAHHCNVHNKRSFCSRCRRDWMKETTEVSSRSRLKSNHLWVKRFYRGRSWNRFGLYKPGSQQRP